MKVKGYYPEYKNWLTEKQWLSKGKVIIDKTKTVTLWSNQFCNVSAIYAAPDNVRNMTDSEKLSFREERKLQRKLAKERQITRYELERARQEELDKATKLAEKLREDWHTEFQWRIFYGREVKENASGLLGSELNEQLSGLYVFGADYFYYNIEETYSPQEEAFNV